MSKKVLYCKSDISDIREMLTGLESEGYVAVEYDEAENDIVGLLNDEFFYFVLSFGFKEDIYKACMGTGTKYVTVWGCEQSVLYERMKESGLVGCYFFLQEEDTVLKIGQQVFDEEEEKLYEIVHDMHVMHKVDSKPVIPLHMLRDIAEDAEVLKHTESFFDAMEAEREPYHLLMEKLLAYIDGLLKRKTITAWMELLLWNKRHECRDLKNVSWKFHLLKKVGDIFAEEMQEYVRGGQLPFVLTLGSFQEIYDTYFRLLFLLRRLEYGIAPEENAEIVEFIVYKRISVVFIRHVITHNKIFNEEKVYVRLEELLSEYGR